MKHLAMTPIKTAWPLAALALSISTAVAEADGKAELIDSRRIWSQREYIAATDLVRFQDCWFCVYQDAKPHSSNDALQVIRSADGQKWESVALIKSPTSKGGLCHPRLSVTPDKRLLLAAVGIVPATTRQAMSWVSADGRDWSKPNNFGEANFVVSDITRHQDMAYSYGYGCICGIAQTVQIRSSKDGRHFGEHFEHTFSGFFPKAASLAFNGDRGVCLLSRSNGPNSDRSTLIGRSQSPYTDWDWKQFDLQMSYPNLICMPDGKIVAAVGLHEPRVRTSLCALDKATGELEEVLKLPTNAWAIKVGLAAYDGHLWVSYHTADGGQYSVHLGKVKLGTRQ